MKIKIEKPIKITEVSNNILQKDQECEVSDSAGKIYVAKGFASEVKSNSKKEEAPKEEAPKEEAPKKEADSKKK